MSFISRLTSLPKLRMACRSLLCSKGRRMNFSSQSPNVDISVKISSKCLLSLKSVPFAIFLNIDVDL